MISRVGRSVSRQLGGIELLEREAEFAVLERVLQDAGEGDGAYVAITGPVGAGKTSLLEAMVEAARSHAMEPLIARGTEVERGFAFGVTRQLVEPALAGRAERLFDGPAGRARALFELGPASEAELDVTLHALYWLVSNLATESPLLIAVDDLQWADVPSQRFISYLGRRLSGLPVSVVTTMRTDEPRGEETAGLPAGAERLEPAPLSVDAVAAMAEQTLGERGRALAEACWRHTGGNPFFVSELLADVSAAGTSVPAELSRLAPERPTASIARRLQRTSRDAQALARSLAILDGRSELAVAGHLAGLDLTAATRAAAELVDAGLIDDERDPRFRHPLTRVAVEAELSAAERAHAHGQTARLLADFGAPSGRIASHLLHSLPSADPWAVQRMREAARAARSQGVPEQAAELLRRALEEPPPPQARAELLRELGAAELAALHPQAAGHLREARDLSRDPGLRAQVTLELATSLYHAGRHSEAVDVLLDGVDETANAPELREEWLRLEAQLATVGRYDLATEARLRGRIQRIVQGLEGATPAERAALATAASERPGRTAAEVFEVERRVLDAVAEGESSDPLEVAGPIATFLHAGKPQAAREAVELLISEAQRRGSPTRHALGIAGRGLVELEVGELPAASADLGAALTDIVDLAPAARVPIAGLYAQAHASRGDLDAAEATRRVWP